GKILNVEKARYDKMLGHEEIRAMITAIGTGIGKDDFNVAKLRYNKIIIMTDADVDGSHIRTLLLTFFFRHMQELITRGHVFIAQPPLYRIKKGKSEKYIKDDKEFTREILRRAIENLKVEIADKTVLEGTELRNQLMQLDELQLTWRRMERRMREPRVIVVITDGNRDTLPEWRALLAHGKGEGTREVNIQRYKGLGEMIAEQLWETAMNADTRTMLKVSLEDLVESDQIFTTLMGEDVEA